MSSKFLKFCFSKRKKAQIVCSTPKKLPRTAAKRSCKLAATTTSPWQGNQAALKRPTVAHMNLSANSDLALCFTQFPFLQKPSCFGLLSLWILGLLSCGFPPRSIHLIPIPSKNIVCSLLPIHIKVLSTSCQQKFSKFTDKLISRAIVKSRAISVQHTTEYSESGL